MILLSIILISITIVESSGVTDKEYAKLPPIFELENFDRCLLFEEKALYCFVEYHLQPVTPENPSTTWKHIENLSANPKNYRHDYLRHGICIPLNCPNISRTQDDPKFKSDLAECMNRKYEHLGIYGTIGHTYCQTAEHPKYDFFDSLFAVILTLYILFVIYSSSYEGLARYKTPEEYKKITSSKYGKIISCFSIPKNWDRLKHIEWTPDNTKFKGIQGIRFYNMFLVILLHAAMIAAAGPVSNTRLVENLYDNPVTIFAASGPYGVSTFFQISAMLVSHSLWKNYDEKSGKELNLKTVLWLLIYRYIRITPSMAFILFLHSTLLYHAGRGPMWDEFLGIDRRNCRKNGWSNLLYISNWMDAPGLCLSETWYLTVDMQAFVLVLALLYFTMKNPRRFWGFLIGAWILNQLYVAWHVYRKSLFHYLRPYPENTYIARGVFEEDGVCFNTLYSTSMNLASTIIGTGLGFLIYKYEKLPSFDTKMSFLIWTFGVYGVALSIIAVPGMWLFSENYYDSQWFSIPYLTFGSTIYSLALAYAMFSVISGQGWMTRWVLEWPPVYYLGRLSYSAYLAHYPLLFYLLGSVRNPVNFNEFGILLESGKLAAMSLVCGLILSLLIEYPISAVSSVLIKQKIKEEDKSIDVKHKIS